MTRITHVGKCITIAEAKTEPAALKLAREWLLANIGGQIPNREEVVDRELAERFWIRVEKVS